MTRFYIAFVATAILVITLIIFWIRGHKEVWIHVYFDPMDTRTFQDFLAIATKNSVLGLKDYGMAKHDVHWALIVRKRNAKRLMQRLQQIEGMEAGVY